jgi:cation diffusion facilitator CzcD-associated flavoprotein CzcO
VSRVAVIGAGMAGILAAIKLREAGHAVLVYEKADRLGGTWRDNAYPGLSCDVPSHFYSYSFALNPSGAIASRRGPRSSRTSRASRAVPGSMPSSATAAR